MHRASPAASAPPEDCSQVFPYIDFLIQVNTVGCSEKIFNVWQLMADKRQYLR